MMSEVISMIQQDIVDSLKDKNGNIRAAGCSVFIEEVAAANNLRGLI